MKFIDAHKGRFGVAPICRVLSEHAIRIAPSTYYDAKARPVSARSLRDADLQVEIARVHGQNYGVYGPRKVWLQLNREGIAVARCTVERLMKFLGLQGIRRGKKWKTTAAANDHNPAPRKPYRVDQQGETSDHHPARLVVPSSWQSGGPITLASDSGLQMPTSAFEVLCRPPNYADLVGHGLRRQLIGVERSA